MVMPQAQEQPASTETRQPVLKVENICKSFGAVVAAENISLEIYAGELVGLVGDNGAGKSTLIKIISGVYRADSGTVYVDGRPAHNLTPDRVRELGIETTYQHLALVNQLRVDGNLFLGREILREGILGRLFGVLNHRKMIEATREAMQRLHINIPGLDKQPVYRMSGGQRQAAAIARSVHWGSKLLLLDEPMAALGTEQTAEVQRLLARTRDHGVPGIVISHNLEHVFAVCDRIIVLRQGRKVRDCRKEETDPQEIVAYITGALPKSAPKSA